MRKTVALFVSLIGLCAVASTVGAQSRGEFPTIGLLFSQESWMEDFLHGLRELGYVAGQNMTIVHRNPNGREESYPALANELVSLKVDLIVVGGLSGARAAQKATKSIPIVIAAGGDPVGSGLVTSLARPGGNITGNSTLSPELNAKRLELIKEVLPKASRIAVLWNPTGAASVAAFKEAEAVAPSLRLALTSLEVKKREDLEPAFEKISRRRADALLVVQNGLMSSNMTAIVKLAAKHRMPSSYWEREFVEAGGFMSYGADNAALYRRAAVFADKILKGAKPSDLPVEQPTKFELLFNLKTAKQIGLTIPPNVLARADKVIR
jgi:putative tryptophan/tyrosine transport system substrate-binding protein